MIRRFLTAVLVVAALSSAASAPASAAPAREADLRPCVTGWEFANLPVGSSREDLLRVWDWRGLPLREGDGITLHTEGNARFGEVRKFRSCARGWGHAVILVEFSLDGSHVRDTFSLSW